MISERIEVTVKEEKPLEKLYNYFVCFSCQFVLLIICIVVGFPSYFLTKIITALKNEVIKNG